MTAADAGRVGDADRDKARAALGYPLTAWTADIDRIALVIAAERARAVADLRAAVEELAEEFEGESVSAMTRADVARQRDDRVLYTTNVRHARVIHQAGSHLRAVLDATSEQQP